VNKRVGDALNAGPGGALTLGMHSMMNSVALRGGPDIEQLAEDFADRIMALMAGWNRIGKWCRAEARRLAEPTQLGDAMVRSVALSDWLRRFPSPTGASMDALIRYSGAELPDLPAIADLARARREYLEKRGN
jgi:hypothetical protein